MDYDPGRGGWGAQAQRAEIERKREMEERYNDAQDVPGAVAGGGGDWKHTEHIPENTLKRARSPEDEGDSGRGVRATISPPNSSVYSNDVHRTLARRLRSMMQVVCERPSTYDGFARLDCTRGLSSTTTSHYLIA